MNEQWQVFNLNPESEEGKWAADVFSNAISNTGDDSTYDVLIEYYKTMLEVDTVSDEMLEKLHLAFSLGYYVCYGLMMQQAEQTALKLVQDMLNNNTDSNL